MIGSYRGAHRKFFCMITFQNKNEMLAIRVIFLPSGTSGLIHCFIYLNSAFFYTNGTKELYSSCKTVSFNSVSNVRLWDFWRLLLTTGLNHFWLFAPSSILNFCPALIKEISTEGQIWQSPSSFWAFLMNYFLFFGRAHSTGCISIYFISMLSAGIKRFVMFKITEKYH